APLCLPAAVADERPPLDAAGARRYALRDPRGGQGGWRMVATPGRATAWQFFTPHEARTIEAAMARLFPSDDLGPGAAEAGAAVYLDRALAGHERDLQPRYRAALTALDALARARTGRPFAE